MLTPREKSPLPKMSPEEALTRDTVDSEPKHYQLSYSGPLFGLVVKASALRAEDPRFESCGRWDFSVSNHTSVLNIGIPVATLPGAPSV